MHFLQDASEHKIILITASTEEDAWFLATLTQPNSFCCIWKWSVAQQDTQHFRMWAVHDIWCVIALPEGDVVIVRIGRAQRLPFNFTRCCFFRKREEKTGLGGGWTLVGCDTEKQTLGKRRSVGRIGDIFPVLKPGEMHPPRPAHVTP